MATNNFLAFCGTDTGTNLPTQGAYAADANRAIGNSPGVASSKLNNKPLRQATAVVSQIAQAVCDKTSLDMLDDNNMANLLAAIKQAFTLPSGTILPYGGTTAPSGYLLCDGTAVSRTTYANLFAIIGTSFGQGNGTTTFNLPDFRGRFIRGRDGAAGRDPNAGTRTAMNTGGATGDNVGSVQTDAFQGHYHTTDGASSSTPGSGAFVVGTGNSPVAARALSPVTDGTNGTPRTSSETRPLNAYVNYIIAA